LGKRILMVVAPTNFRDEELLKPKEILEIMGAQVTITSRGVSKATGMFGAEVKVDKQISEVMSRDYDAVVFIGGGGSSVYFNDSRALTLAREAYKSGKVVAAICIAPSILANAGILEGKKATAFASEAENLRAKGADYTGSGVEVDENIITGKGPEYAREFGKKIAEKLKL
jgi:protease I